MRKRKLEKDIRIPLEYGFDILGGRWNSRIIGALYHEPAKRFSQIKAELDGISDTALSAALKQLLEEDMIRRDVIDAKPPMVEYCLTEKGESSVPLLRSICAWAVQYHPEFSDASHVKCRDCSVFARATYWQD